MFKYASIVSLAVLLSSCGGWASRNSVDTTRAWDNRYHTQKLRENEFRMEVIRITDMRRVRDRLPDNSENVIYEYDMDELLSGVRYRLPVLFEKHFNFNNNAPEPVYRVELELKKLRADIKTGTLKHGPFGYYENDFEAFYIVRRPDSSVLVQGVVDFRNDRTRKSKTGRDPSIELDKQRMFDLVEAGIRKAAQRITWKVRLAHRDEVRAWEEVQEEAMKQKELQGEQPTGNNVNFY